MYLSTLITVTGLHVQTVDTYRYQLDTRIILVMIGTGVKCLIPRHVGPIVTMAVTTMNYTIFPIFRAKDLMDITNNFDNFDNYVLYS